MILVIGGTGDLGGRVVRLLREQGEEVRALVRQGSDASELRSAGVEVVAGDLTDPASLARACDGASIVIATATSMGRILAGQKSLSMREVDEDGMAALVSAAEAAGAERFIYVSFAGADQGVGSPLEHAKLATERRLRAAKIQATVLRPDAFQEIHLAPIGRFDIAAGKVSTFGRGDTERRYVSTQDVAALIAKVVREADAPEVIEFGGPESMSRNGAVRVAERITGRPIKVRRLPLPIAGFLMRRMSRRNPALASVFGAGLAQDKVPASWDDMPLRERGIVPRSVSDYLTEQASALAVNSVD
jgi:uncharacterized protein YbjT (DUF2867 family)